MLGPEIKFVDRDYLIFERKKLLYLGGIDYHRMSNNPMIIQSMSENMMRLRSSSMTSARNTDLSAVSSMVPECWKIA